MPYRFVTVEGPAVLEGGADDIAFEMAARDLGETGAKAYVEQTTGLRASLPASHPSAGGRRTTQAGTRSVMTVQTIGLVGVGAVGAGIGGSLVSAGSHVISVLADRSTASRARAVVQGIEEVDDLGAVMARSRILLSIVPPGVASAVVDGAARVATDVGAEGRVFVDCNAISPGRSRQIAGAVRAAGNELRRWRW